MSLQQSSAMVVISIDRLWAWAQKQFMIQHFIHNRWCIALFKFGRNNGIMIDIQRWYNKHLFYIPQTRNCWKNSKRAKIYVINLHFQLNTKRTMNRSHQHCKKKKQ